MKTDYADTSYRRNAAAVTEREVSPPKSGKGILSLARLRGDSARKVPEEVRRDAEEVITGLSKGIGQLRPSLAKLRDLRRPRLLGKVEDEIKQLDRAQKLLSDANTALEQGDVGACGKAVRDAHRQLSTLGGQLTVALNQELGQASFSREMKAALQENIQKRQDALDEAEGAQEISARAGILASSELYRLMAEGLALAAEILGAQAAPVVAPAKLSSGSDDAARVVQPHELETFDDVGGLEDAKERLQRTIGVMLERSADAANAGLVINGVLLYGPPGTGKTMLARAVAGEYGLRFIRFSPAAIASAYQHEPAKKLRQLFATAAEAAPCLLFLDEVDAIAGRREGGGASVDQREIVTQLLNSLEEYRRVPGLVIMAATNTLDQLDPALREGRFDVRIAVPLPDLEARKRVVEVQLEASGLDVDWDSIDLDEVAQATSGRSGAALGSIVSGAAQRALSEGSPISQEHLMQEIEGRSGQDRAQTFEEQISWDDVVLGEDARRRLQEILLVFEKPELGRKLGVRAPAGILLYGPPGTGKTTIAKALAAQVKASFYEQSAADLISKWVGESEQKVAQLFTRARNNRPSIIFIDEIDALLKRRMSDSSAPWEERVVSQFLRELDGLHTGEGVLLVGATNRPDIIDEAVRERRLDSIEVPLPDAEGRTKLLEVLCREVQISPDVDFASIARAAEGLSGADLKSIRNSAGMRALTRAALDGDHDASITEEDFSAALKDRGIDYKPSRPKSRGTKQSAAKPSATKSSKGTAVRSRPGAAKAAAKPGPGKQPAAKRPAAKPKRTGKRPKP